MFGKFDDMTPPPDSSNPKPGGGVMGQMKMLQRLMQDPDFRLFLGHPRVKELFRDPEFQEIAKSKDFARMAAYPKFAELMRDPELAALMQKIKPLFTGDNP